MATENKRPGKNYVKEKGKKGKQKVEERLRVRNNMVRDNERTGKEVCIREKYKKTEDRRGQQGRD